MWKKNFLFRAHEAAPLKESENELFHDTEPALDSAGLQMEKFLSVWVQGEGEDDSPTMYTNLYVRTATLGFPNACRLSPAVARPHTPDQTDVDAGAKGIFARVVVENLALKPGRSLTTIFELCSTSSDPLWQDVEKVRQRRSRIVQTLNVPPGKSACPGRRGAGG